MTLQLRANIEKDNRPNMGFEHLYYSYLNDLGKSNGKKRYPYSLAKFNTACLRNAFPNGRNHIC